MRSSLILILLAFALAGCTGLSGYNKSAAPQGWLQEAPS
jgi:hypothetical protein